MRLVPKEDEGLSFKQWAVAKFKEVEGRLNPCNDDGSLDPVRLNQVLTTFAAHFAWSITLQEIESNTLNVMQHDYDTWYKTQYNHAYRTIQTETGGGRAPGQITIDSRMVDMVGEEMEARKIAVEDQKSRVGLLKGMVKVLEKQANLLQTLASNMRSELFFASGITMKGDEVSKNNVAKAALRSAMRGQGVEGS